MTIEEFIYDVRTVLRQVAPDSDFSDLFILRKGLNYRVLFILENYNVNRLINTDWLMRLGNKKLTPVGSADNPNIVDGSVKLGKTTIPQLIPIGVDNGIPMVMNTQRQKQIYNTTWPVLMHMIQSRDARLELFSYYCQIGSDLYVYRYTEEVDLTVIPENPLDCVEFATGHVLLSEMVNGTEYYVISGNIKETLDGTDTVYLKNQTFIYNENSTYLSNGKYRNDEQIKSITATTRFPADSGMVQRIILEMLTKDFAIEIRNIPDTYVNAADERKATTKEPRYR